MQIDISPGGPPAPLLHDGGMIPVTNTDVPIQNSDQFLSALDADTREFFTALVEATGDGLRGRGPDLRALLRTLGPTSRQIRQLGDALVGRRTQLERLVHNLSVLAVAAGSKDKQLAQVVSAGDQTLRALAGQDVALREAIGRLPGTLSAAQRSLIHTTAFADQLGPTLQALEPSARRLPGALSAAKPLLDLAVPVARKQLRPFVRALVPVARDAAPATADFATVVPELSSSLQVFNYFVNELSYNQGGVAQNYLKWIAWFAHNAASVTSTQDAHGPMIRGMAVVSCASLTAQPALAPLVQLLIGTTPLCK
jgi:phospholipid/cholesterol/gamma-HCH transport system substrate-binding protein